MKSTCKECPWVIRNRHNDTIVNFSIKTGKNHNCHMSNEGKINLWLVKKNSECIGRKQFNNLK